MVWIQTSDLMPPNLPSLNGLNKGGYVCEFKKPDRVDGVHGLLVGRMCKQIS